MTNRFSRYTEGGDNNRFSRFAGQRDEPVSRGSAFMSGATDALTFGFADELGGVIGGEGVRDRMRAEQELARAYHPNTFMAGQFGGALVGGGGAGLLGRGALRAIPGAAGAAGRLAARVGPVGRIGAGVATGAAGGALYGAGDSPDGMRAEGAANGALWGAAFGGAGQAAGEVIGRVGGALGRSLSPEARASHMIGGMQQRFGQSGDDLAASLRDAPEGALVMDVLPGGTQLASGAAARPSAGRDALRDALDQRNNGAAQSAVDDIWRNLGGGARRSASATMDDLAREQQATARPLYEQAFSRPIDPRRAQALLGDTIRRNPRLFEGARRDADELMMSEHGTRFNESDPRFWHYLQQGADQVYEKLRNQQGGLSGNERRVFGRALHAYRVQLRRLLGPEFGRAQDTWAGHSRQRLAIQTGFEAVAAKADDLALGDLTQAIRRASPGELDAMRIGALAKLTDLLENADTMTGRADPVRAILRSQGQRRVLETMFGGQSQFEGVIRRLEQSRQLFRNSVESGVGVNSHTADRLLAYQSQVDRTNPTRGGIKDAVLRLITGDAADQYDEAVSNQLLDTLRIPARDAASQIDASGGVQQWSRGRGLLSRAVRERARLAEQRRRALGSALTGGLYAPVIGGSATSYGGL